MPSRMKSVMTATAPDVKHAVTRSAVPLRPACLKPENITQRDTEARSDETTPPKGTTETMSAIQTGYRERYTTSFSIRRSHDDDIRGSSVTKADFIVQRKTWHCRRVIVNTDASHGSAANEITSDQELVPEVSMVRRTTAPATTTSIGSARPFVDTPSRTLSSCLS